MPVVINGTTGITNVDGSAAAPAATGTTSTTTGLYYGTNTVGLATNGTAALTVNASQNVAVSTSLSVAGNNISAVNSIGFRNRIINGDMVIDQRNNGASVSFAASSSGYTVDRMQFSNVTDGSWTAQRSTTTATGFINSLLLTVTAADTSLAATQFASVQQNIEGFNVDDLGWGTASAQTVTLSFWVRSSLTGTFGGAFVNSGQTRSYPFTYTINSANTFEYKTVTVAGDTSGTWLTDNGIGIRVYFGLGVGSTYSGTAGAWSGSLLISATGATSVVGTNGATFYITGVQLEAGSVATPFERRPYGDMLVLCQRYFETYALNNTSLIGNSLGTASAATVLPFKVTKRAAPTVTLPAAGQTSGTVSFLVSSGAFPAVTGTNTATTITVDKTTIDGTSYTGLTASTASIFWSNGSSTIQISAEL